LTNRVWWRTWKETKETTAKSFLTKMLKVYVSKKDSHSTSVAEKTGYSHVYNSKLDPYLSCIKINSKWIKDLAVCPETLIFLQGKHLKI
jgi:hypothetical protein